MSGLLLLLGDKILAPPAGESSEIEGWQPSHPPLGVEPVGEGGLVERDPLLLGQGDLPARLVRDHPGVHGRLAQHRGLRGPRGGSEQPGPLPAGAEPGPCPLPAAGRRWQAPATSWGHPSVTPRGGQALYVRPGSPGGHCPRCPPRCPCSRQGSTRCNAGWGVSAATPRTPQGGFVPRNVSSPRQRSWGCTPRMPPASPAPASREGWGQGALLGTGWGAPRGAGTHLVCSWDRWVPLFRQETTSARQGHRWVRGSWDPPAPGPFPNPAPVVGFCPPPPGPHLRGTGSDVSSLPGAGVPNLGVPNSACRPPSPPPCPQAGGKKAPQDPGGALFRGLGATGATLGWARSSPHPRGITPPPHLGAASWRRTGGGLGPSGGWCC